ncbi:hypothetical protein OM427_19875 [Halomonas sp. 18H]|uniref:hypothetical protein n=1 Tax=Halomonas almeriensis TaxID=308163 RepID=UPI0022306710|nr:MULTISPECIES: hypothetical protein [Halomonas]MCW4151780.1 hypothetical protein [Halomonas sp. 18H]MDN3554026.1 hypothetical protein [Halomonas almeriensis]
MKHRGLVLCLGVPLGFLTLLGGLIFGGQAISAIKLDSEIEQALANKLAIDDAIQVDHLQRVNNGYGYCGLYKSASAEDGYASFFYNTIEDRVTVDIKSDRFTSNCGLSSFC